MKVVLIETTSEAYRKNPLSQMDRVLEPLGIEYIGAHLKACGHDVQLIQQLTLSTDEVVNQVVSLRPDLVGFSCMTYSYPEAVTLAKSIKQEIPEIKTVLGGYHVLGIETPPEYFDFVIKGEGELATEKILDFIAGKVDVDIPNIPGLMFFQNQKWDIPMERCNFAQIENPMRLPRGPFRSMSMGENLPDTKIACVVAGRGCPYRCDFCCTPQLYSGKRVCRPVEDVVSEIFMLRDQFGVNNINLRDETFTPDKEYVIAFCNEMIERQANISWRAFANVGNVNEEIIKLMAEAGCHMLFYGIEASDPETLKRRRKNFSSKERIIEAIKMTQEAGIYVRAGFIVGHETDTLESFIHHDAFLREVCPDELYISFLTPFPGTPLYQEIKKTGRLLTTDLERYDCEHPVIDIGMPEEELIRMRNELYKGFYSSKEWTGHVLKRAKGNPKERDEIERYAAFISDKHNVSNPFINLKEAIE